MADRDHYNKVLEAVMATSNVTITRVVPDGLTIDSAAASRESSPLGEVNRAQPLPSSFTAGSPATLAAMMQSVPAPPAGARAHCSGDDDFAEPSARHRFAVRRARPAAADVCTGHCGGRPGPGPLRPAGDARLRLAQLRRLSELRRGYVPQAVFADRVAVHRPVLSLSASPLGMAESQPAMGRRLVVVGLQRQVQQLLVAVRQLTVGWTSGSVLPGEKPAFPYRPEVSLNWPRAESISTGFLPFAILTPDF